MKTEHVLSPSYLANEVARLAALGGFGIGWHRVAWHSLLADMRLDIDEYSAKYIVPAMQGATQADSNRIRALAHLPPMYAAGMQGGVQAEICGSYYIETDQFGFVAYFEKPEAKAA